MDYSTLTPQEQGALVRNRTSLTVGHFRMHLRKDNPGIIGALESLSTLLTTHSFQMQPGPVTRVSGGGLSYTFNIRNCVRYEDLAKLSEDDINALHPELEKLVRGALLFHEPLYKVEWEKN